MNNLPLILLIGENLLLLIALIIYLTRKCSKCQQVKCIERVFNKNCWKCEKSSDKSKNKTAPSKRAINTTNTSKFIP